MLCVTIKMVILIFIRILLPATAWVVKSLYKSIIMSSVTSWLDEDKDEAIVISCLHLLGGAISYSSTRGKDWGVIFHTKKENKK